MLGSAFRLLALAVAAAALPVADNAPVGSELARRAPWQPAVGTQWQIILSKKLRVTSTNTAVTPNVPVYDIDMFDHQSTTAVQGLHNTGRKVICYFSAGSWENWRPDANQFPTTSYKNPVDDWPGEKWLNTRDATVRKLMANRIKIAAQMGCDGIDPDNVDGYDHDTGFSLTEDDLVDYVKFLATEAAKYNMGCGLKNALSIIPRVLSYVQFAVNEQCAQYQECASVRPFINAGKPVFHIEYNSNAGALSGTPCAGFLDRQNFSTVIKNLALDGKVTYCDGTNYQTATQ